MGRVVRPQRRRRRARRRSSRCAAPSSSATRRRRRATRPERLPPPRGASAGASVEVASAARVARITEDRITVEKRAAPPPAAAAAAAAAAPTSKRARAPDAYDYTRIARLREMAAGGGGAGGVAALAPKEVHVHAVVLAYTLPRETRGEDMKSTITLVDESCDGRGDALVVNFFKAHQEAARHRRRRPLPPAARHALL